MELVTNAIKSCKRFIVRYNVSTMGGRVISYQLNKSVHKLIYSLQIDNHS